MNVTAGGKNQNPRGGDFDVDKANGNGALISFAGENVPNSLLLWFQSCHCVVDLRLFDFVSFAISNISKVIKFKSQSIFFVAHSSEEANTGFCTFKLIQLDNIKIAIVAIQSFLYAYWQLIKS